MDKLGQTYLIDTAVVQVGTVHGAVKGACSAVNIGDCTQADKHSDSVAIVCRDWLSFDLVKTFSPFNVVEVNNLWHLYYSITEPRLKSLT